MPEVLCLVDLGLRPFQRTTLLRAFYSQPFYSQASLQPALLEKIQHCELLNSIMYLFMFYNKKSCRKMNFLSLIIRPGELTGIFPRIDHSIFQAIFEGVGIGYGA